MTSRPAPEPVKPYLLMQGIINSPDDISLVKGMRPHLQSAKSAAEGWYFDTIFIEKFHDVARQVTQPENFTLMLRMLMDTGMPIDIQNNNGETALHGANNLAIPCLIKMGVALNAKDHFGHTPLNSHCAQSLSGFDELQWELQKSLAIETLVNWPAALEEPNNERFTPLLSACNSKESNPKRKLDVLKFLIDNGANIHAVDKKNNSIVDIWLDKSGDLETFVLLKSHGANISPEQLQKAAIKAIIKDDVALLEEVLQTGLSRAGAHDGPSDALHFACVINSPASCAKLLEWGWDPLLPVHEAITKEQVVSDIKISAYEAALNSQAEKNRCLDLIQAWMAQKEARQAIEEAINDMGCIEPMTTGRITPQKTPRRRSEP